MLLPVFPQVRSIPLQLHPVALVDGIFLALTGNTCRLSLRVRAISKPAPTADVDGP